MQFHEMSYFSKYKLFKQSVSCIFGSLRYRWKYHSQTLTIPPSQVYPWTLRMIFPELSLIWTLLRKKRLFVYQSHILSCDITLLPFIHLSRQSQNHECVFSAQGAVYLWRPVISLSGVCVCVFVTKLVLQTHWTKWHVPHTLLSRTHYLSHTLIQDPAHLPWAQPPPTLIDSGCLLACLMFYSS